MSTAALIMDAVILLIFIIQIRRGLHSGLLRTVVECLAWLVAMVLAAMISQVVSGVIYNMFFSGKVTELLTQAATENSSPEAFAAAMNQALESLPAAVRAGVEFVMESINLDIAAVDGAQLTEFAQTVAESVVRPIITSMIQLVCFVLLFILGMIILRLVAVAFGMFNSIPLVGGLNRLLGGALGAVKAAVMVFVLLAGVELYLASSAGQGEFLNWDTIQKSVVTPFFYENNPISHFLLGE